MKLKPKQQFVKNIIKRHKFVMLDPRGAGTRNGKYAEYLLTKFCEQAWKELGGERRRIQVCKEKIEMPINKNLSRKDKGRFKDAASSTVIEYDRVCRIDGRMVFDGECKHYMDATMFKATLWGMTRLKEIHSSVKDFVVFELQPAIEKDVRESLLSHSPDIRCTWITLLPDRKRSNTKKITTKEYFIPIRKEIVEQTLEQLKNLLRPFL